MPRSLIAVGSNLGDREGTLRRAVERLTADPAVRDVRVSSFHQTPPVGGPPGQGPFVNAAIALTTTLEPEPLFQLTRRVEIELGRKPEARWSARTIDLDLLLYGEQVISTTTLSVPHPRMAFRRFVLAPAAEVAPQMVHPLVGWSIERLLAHLDSAPPYVALLGMPDEGKATLARRVARAGGGTYLAGPEDGPSAAEPGNSSGHAEQRQIQFLDRAASRLRSHEWRSARQVAISDFYFDERLVYARAALDDAAFGRFHAVWAAARDTLVAPKLLVVLDTWERGLSVRQTPAAGRLGDEASPDEKLRRELLSLANRGDQGPVLYVGRHDPQSQFDEITAAIAAME